MKEINRRWRKQQIIGLDCIVNQNGQVQFITITSKKDHSIKETFGRSYKMNILSSSTIEKLQEKYEDDIWSEVEIYDKVHLENNCTIYCGEGEMGNEGFILKVNNNNNLEWSIFSTTSNPFIKLKILENTIHAMSSHNFWIIIDIDDLSKIRISNHDTNKTSLMD